MEKVYGYIRVSSRDQNEDRQLIALKEVGVTDRNIYLDKQSGIGRISDETTTCVAKLVKLGIEIWSVSEGQLNLSTCVDKFMTNTRLWAAEMESEKTSLRTKAALSQMVLNGHFRGGTPPYGYRLEKCGRLNVAGEEVNDIFIDETEATTVRRIFELSAVQGCGSRRISSILTGEGLYNRVGKSFPPSTIQNMLKNPMYTGILRSGETSSAIFPHLQIISPELFELAQQQIASHRSDYEDSRLSPEKPGRNTLLSGNIFCGMCGARLYTTTSRTTHHRTVNVENRREALYRCASHLAHKRPCRCSGPTTYRASRVDAVVENAVKEILRRIQITGVSEYLAKQRAAETGALKAQLKRLEHSHAAAAAERQKLTQYILSALEGNGPFSAEDLKGRMDTLQEECSTLSEQMTKQRELLENSENRERLIAQQFELLKSYAEVYESASVEEKRKIISALIERVEVSRGYHIQIQFRIGTDLLNGIETVA